MRKRLGLLFLTLCGLYAMLTGGLYSAMRLPPETFGAIAAYIPMPAFMLLPFRPLWMSARAGSLAVGDTAPDFDLPTVDHQSRVKLSTITATRPVVLVFGSYT